MIPQMIGRYRIKAELGRGGMSTVYLAHDPHFERDVAIKLLPLELLHQSTFRRRFEREAKVVAALDHPAIVPVYDFGEEDGQPFLVMRFMTGGSLLDRLKHGALSIHEAAAIISRLAPALDEVHAHGVIHRDLKPSNILFDQRSDPYLSDFGTAKLSQAQTKLTETGGAVGTPAYMSPEQIQGDGEIDGRSDIYSLGVILFEMLTGKHPYDTDTPIAVAVKHIFEPVPHILDADPNLPIECQEIIAKAMAKNRADRYVTAVAFAAALANIANKIETTTFRALNDPRKRREGHRYALLISATEYQDSTLARLVKPSANLNQLAQVLKDPEIGGFQDVITLQNEPAHVIRRTISRFFTNKNPNDLLLLYYIGHAAIGARSRLYLTAANTEHKLLRGTAIPASFIADEMDNSLSKQQILILDCHYSNAIDTDLPHLVGQTVNTGATFSRNGHERVVITATDSTQYNWYKDEIKGKAAPSQFTRHLVQGLQSGAADLDHNGLVTIEELFAYIYDRVARNSVDEQIQTPRKWVPFTGQEPSPLVIARNPNPLDHDSAYRTPGVLFDGANSGWAGQAFRLKTAVSNLALSPARLAATAGLLLLIAATLLLSGQFSSAGAPAQTAASNVAAQATTPTATIVTAVSTHGAITTATNNNGASLPTETAANPVPGTETTATATRAAATPTPTIFITPTPTIAPATDLLTIKARLSSSLFTLPDADSTELGFVGVDEQVLLLGRSEFGEWLYIRTEDGLEGFVYGPRFDWTGDNETLAIIDTDAYQPTAVSTCGPNCPALTVDIYPLPGARCTPNVKYRSVFIRGFGGNGEYTYFWNNRRIAGPLSNEGFAFEVSSADGAAVIGVGKVVSGDGQVIEKELFVSDFTCN